MKRKIKQTKQNIFYMIIGRIVTFLFLYVGSIVFILWAFSKMTVYR